MTPEERRLFARFVIYLILAAAVLAALVAPIIRRVMK